MKKFFDLQNLFSVLLFFALFGCTERDLNEEVLLHSEIKSAVYDFEQVRVFSKGVHSTEDLNFAGPFFVKSHLAYEIQISPQLKIKTDLFLPTHEAKAPIVVFVHGNGSNRWAHRNQCQRMASWGYYAVCAQVPPRGQWVQNGWLVKDLARYLKKWPEILSPYADPARIYLVGHSFGGSAVSMAAGLGAPVSGLVLLDPAVVHSRVEEFLGRIRVPMILLGADRKVFRARKRALFYTKYRGPALEVSLKGTTHNEAQYPSMLEATLFGIDPTVEEWAQERFTASILVALLSMEREQPIDWAQFIFEQDAKKGWMSAPKHKGSVARK